MTIARNADRPSRKVQFTLSPEARAVLAEIPQGMRSKWVDEAIREKAAGMKPGDILKRDDFRSCSLT